MAVSDFSAQLDDWVGETKERILAVRNQATEDVIDKMREYTPIDFGFLAGTIQAAVNAPVPIDPKKSNESEARLAADASAGQISLVIANSKLSDTVYATFTMAYALPVEYGSAPHMIYPKNATALHFKMGGKDVFATSVHHPGTAPAGMARRAAMEWPQIVNSVTSRAKARAGAS